LTIIGGPLDESIVIQLSVVLRSWKKSCEPVRILLLIDDKLHFGAR